MEFVKLHGGGNDYVVVDGRSTSKRWSSVAKRACDRHYGIGADGLLVVLRSRKADLRMRMFNPDGSEAEICCNGTRCFAKYVLDRGILDLKVMGRDHLRVEAPAGIITVTPQFDEKGLFVTAWESVVPPEFNPAKIPMTSPEGPLKQPLLDVMVDGRHLVLNCVAVGNPHAIAFVEDPVDTFPLDTIGPQIEHHPAFPNRTNFEIVNILSPSQVRARVWERGVGETRSCGSGACAIGAVGQARFGLDQHLDVALPGGLLQVEWDGSGPVQLFGPAEVVFSGELPS